MGHGCIMGGSWRRKIFHILKHIDVGHLLLVHYIESFLNGVFLDIFTNKNKKYTYSIKS